MPSFEEARDNNVTGLVDSFGDANAGSHARGSVYTSGRAIAPLERLGNGRYERGSSTSFPSTHACTDPTT